MAQSSKKNFGDWIRANYDAEVCDRFEALKKENPSENNVSLLEKALAVVYSDEYLGDEENALKQFNSDSEEWSP